MQKGCPCINIVEDGGYLSRCDIAATMHISFSAKRHSYLDWPTHGCKPYINVGEDDEDSKKVTHN